MRIKTGILAALALTLPLATCGQQANRGEWVVWGSNRTGEKHDIF